MYRFIIGLAGVKMPKGFLINYFGFNKQQRNGLLVLISLSLFLFIVRLTYPFFIVPDNIIVKSLPLYEKQLDSSYNQGVFSKNAETLTKEGIQLFVFNPNTVTFQQLLKLGFKKKAAKTFLNYRSKGFVFKKKTDMKKVYGVSDEFYTKLEPYILLNENEKRKEQKELIVEAKQEKSTNKTDRQTLNVELNSVDSITLLKLDGIGPSYAKRILKYRSILGGFTSIEQLKEVYGFTEELYEKIKSSVRVEVQLIKKININKDDFKTINKHPYISYELTKSIFDWRRKTTINGTSIQGIINDDKLYKKLLPYLTFD